MDRVDAAQRKPKILARIAEIHKEESELLAELDSCEKVLNNSDLALNMFRQEQQRILDRQRRIEEQRGIDAENNRLKDEQLHEQRRREREMQNRRADYISRMTGH